MKRSMLGDTLELILHSAHEFDSDLFTYGQSKKVWKRVFHLFGRSWLTSNSTLLDYRSVELVRCVAWYQLLLPS